MLPQAYQQIGDFEKGMLTFIKDNKQGLLDRTGHMLAEAKYARIDVLPDGNLRVNVGGESGHKILMKGGDEPFFNGGKWGLISASGKVLLAPTYSSMSDFSGGLAIVSLSDKEGSKFGYIDAMGRVSAGLKFSNAKPFTHDLAWVETPVKDDWTAWRLIDKTGRFVSPVSFERVQGFHFGLAIEEKTDGGFALIDSLGDIRDFKPQPQMIQPEQARESSGNSVTPSKKLNRSLSNDWKSFIHAGNGLVIASTSYNGGIGGRGIGEEAQYGILDTSGKVLAINESLYSAAEVLAEGRIKVNFGGRWKSDRSSAGSRGDQLTGGKWGVIDKSGNRVLEILYTDFDGSYGYDDGFHRVRRDGKWGLVTTRGDLILKPQYDAIYQFSDGLAVVEKANKYGYIDTTGKEIVKPAYSWATEFKEGFGKVNLGFNPKSTKNEAGGKWGLVDKSGKEILAPQYESIGDFSEGVAMIVSGGSWRKGREQHQGGKVGFIDTTGKVVIAPQYDDVHLFQSGVAWVNVGAVPHRDGGMVSGKWGLIDKFGRQLLAPGYDLLEVYDGGIAKIRLADINTTAADYLEPADVYMDLRGVMYFSAGGAK